MIAPRLHPGDKVAVISISNSIAQWSDQLDAAITNFERATGLVVVRGKHVLAKDYYSAGTVEQRMEDFNWAIQDPEIKAVIFSVGGYTAIEMLEHIDFDMIAAHPKIIAGISDATTLLAPITARTGLVTFLGIEFLHFADYELQFELGYIKKAWFTGEIGQIQPNPDWRDLKDVPTSYSGWQTIRPGLATGKVVGGNFESFAQLAPSELSQNLEGNILVLETYMKGKRELQQAFAQLRLWGVYDQIAGMVVGYCVGSDDPKFDDNKKPLADIILESAKGYEFPIMQIGEVGHHVENIMLPLGATARIDATLRLFEIVEPVTE